MATQVALPNERVKKQPVPLAAVAAVPIGHRVRLGEDDDGRAATSRRSSAGEGELGEKSSSHNMMESVRDGVIRDQRLGNVQS